MAPQVAQWVTFDDDEKLKKEETDPFEFSSAAAKDFEFRTYDGGCGLPDDMCVADEVFFKGRILPLRPGSRSDDSIDRSSSAHTLTTSSRSNSSGSGSRSSRSSSGALEPPRRSVSNNFYAHPSPTPQAWRRQGSGGRRRSTGSPPPPGWGLFRLGVAKAPEIDLSDLRCRRLNSGEIGLRKSTEKAAESGGVNKTMMRFLGRGFGCRCSSTSATTAATVARKGSVGHNRRRMIEWLDEL